MVTIRLVDGTAGNPTVKAPNVLGDGQNKSQTGVALEIALCDQPRDRNRARRWVMVTCRLSRSPSASDLRLGSRPSCTCLSQPIPTSGTVPYRSYFSG